MKGSRFENLIVNRLKHEGVVAARLPLSGAMRGKYGGCDVTMQICGTERRAELKREAHGWQKLYDWISKVDLLIVRADYSEPLVVLPWKTFVELIKAAEQIPESHD